MSVQQVFLCKINRRSKRTSMFTSWWRR